MRCKKHPYQTGGGVCATCLCDRLLALAAEQNGGASPPPPDPIAAVAVETAPSAFPRSVSPYVSRRKSDTSAGVLKQHPSLLFFRTPQVGPAYGSSGALEEGDIGYEKRRAGKFSLIATLFGRHLHHHRSEEDDKGGSRDRRKRSWLAGFMPRRRQKQVPAAVSSSPPPRLSCRAVSNRGLSPERDSYGRDEEISLPPDPPWPPMRRTPCRRRQPSTMPSGFAVCLSPLVRPSPGRRHRAVQPPDQGTFSCELRPSPLHNLSSASSITRCRSRKLADGGRFR
ncbi:hypothetical protein GUJ93_ZPchr0006g45919 [Zizania palustris]|uniref:Uncharacterized protein n=1 Tax=Zizania palustris TaxID=103762 RepID=A0A8J5T836_ZIZPA|nr:hypothetical protein GUJ93_ZPchr0006g45919 [Zizania palustris]